MKRIAAIACISIAALPLTSFAGAEGVVCPFSHFVRAGGTEMRTSTLGFRNTDLVNPATIERITIRNTFGQIVHDSGPAIGVPHPVSAVLGGLDITTVQPGAAPFLLSNDFWGLDNVPGPTGPNQGFNMSVTVEISKKGKAELLVVGSRQRSRDRFVDPDNNAVFEGAERSSNSVACVSVKPQ